MKVLLQAGLKGRVPLPPEKRYSVSQTNGSMKKIVLAAVGGMLAAGVAMAATAAEKTPGAKYEPPVFDIPKMDGIVVDGKPDDWGERGFRVGVAGGHSSVSVGKSLPPARWPSRTDALELLSSLLLTAVLALFGVHVQSRKSTSGVFFNAIVWRTYGCGRSYGDGLPKTRVVFWNDVLSHDAVRAIPHCRVRNGSLVEYVVTMFILSVTENHDVAGTHECAQ